MSCNVVKSFNWHWKNNITTKDRFFAYLSHEIRNPLTSILGTTEKIVNEITDEEIKKQVRRLQKSTFQVNEILEQVLDFSSMNADQISLHMDHVDVIEVCWRYDRVTS